MGLPDTREETVTSAGQVRSSTLNKIQDCIWGRKKARYIRWFTFLKGQYLEASVSFNYFEVVATADAGFVSRPVEFLEPGDVIYKVWARLNGSAAAANTVITLLDHRDTITTAYDTFTIVNPPLGFVDYSKTLGTPLTILDGHIYGVSCALGKLNRSIAGIGFELGKP